MLALTRPLMLSLGCLLLAVSLVACTQTKDPKQPKPKQPKPTPTLDSPALNSDKSAMRAYRDSNTGEFITVPEETQTPSPETPENGRNLFEVETDAAVTRGTQGWVESPVPGGGEYFETPKNLKAPLKAEKNGAQVEISH